MYICGIRYKYLESGTNSVFSNASDKLYRLDALKRGIKKNESHSTKPSLPITFGLLRDICHLLRRTYFTPYTDILLAATCVMAYFGFLRCGEFPIVHSVDPNAMYVWKMCISIKTECFYIWKPIKRILFVRVSIFIYFRQELQFFQSFLWIDMLNFEIKLVKGIMINNHSL